MYNGRMIGLADQRILQIFNILVLLIQATDTQINQNYVGCFEDRRNEWSFFWWPPGRSARQTATSCNQLCSTERFSYFGMGGNYGTDCHCGNGGYDIYPPSGECTTCDQFGVMFGCGAKGGDNRIISVYKAQITGTSRITDDRFIGCWSAGNPKEVLDIQPMTIVENDIQLSLESCLRQCWRRGYSYAGIMFATHCYCGSDLQWEGDNRAPVATSSCDVTCNGNDAHVCGGRATNVIAIYRAAPTESFWSTNIGCFTDLRHDWVFFWWPDMKFSKFHPLSSCFVQCKEQGFLYFGLGGRYGSECYCGNGNYARYGKSGDCKECSMLGETFSCGPRWGGYRLLSVYTIGDQPAVDQRYVGCWSADNPIYVLGDQPIKTIEDLTGLTVSRCIDECVKVGMFNAGLMRGSQCYCGSSLKWEGTNKLPALAALCDARCSGDASKVCGGVSSPVISIYRAECPNGTYAALGRGCSSCNCERGVLCNRTTGVCPEACGPGWTREGPKGACSQQCQENKYGVQCQHTCHCYSNVPCDRILGKCPGPCAPGWDIPVGDLACSRKWTISPTQTQKQEKKKNILPIALGVGLGGFFLLVVIIIVCCYKKRKAAKTKKRLEEEAAARKLEEARRKKQQRRKRQS